MRHLFFCLTACCLFFGSAWSAVVLKDGRLIDARYVSTQSAQEHYQLGMQAIENQCWSEAVTQFNIIIINFPASIYAQESYYYLAIAYFYENEIDLANKNLTIYLQNGNPKHFKDAICYKFAIAERFAGGARRHLFGWEKMPKWLSSKEMALSIFDEVETALPNDEIAAQALYAKGNLLFYMHRYKESVEAYQSLIRRFPKNFLTPECYLMISKVYACEMAQQSADPDLLGLAQINLKRFRNSFPGDLRIEEAECQYVSMQEYAAHGLYEMGRFYERIKQPGAAVIYYKTTISQYPNTSAAEFSQMRLQAILPPQEEQICEN